MEISVLPGLSLSESKVARALGFTYLMLSELQVILSNPPYCQAQVIAVIEKKQWSELGHYVKQSFPDVEK